MGLFLLSEGVGIFQLLVVEGVGLFLLLEGVGIFHSPVVEGVGLFLLEVVVRVVRFFLWTGVGLFLLATVARQLSANHSLLALMGWEPGVDSWRGLWEEEQEAVRKLSNLLAYHQLAVTGEVG